MTVYILAGLSLPPRGSHSASENAAGYAYTTDLLKLNSFVNKGPMLPAESTSITTPLHWKVWESCLRSHPDTAFAGYIVSGLHSGFRIGCDAPSIPLRSVSDNMPSARLHSSIISSYLDTECKSGWVFGPLPSSVSSLIHHSRFGVIPKKSQPGKWRLIVDLSFPPGNSINDGIRPELASLAYTSVDEAAQLVLSLGRGCQLAKLDIQSVYRLVPVHPDDRWLLGMFWHGEVYIDTVLPFGLHSAPKIFTAVADALEWILQRKGLQFLMHYLDDFLFLGRPNSTECAFALQTGLDTCAELGAPVVPHKVHGPATLLDFLGILFDTMNMELRLPPAKLQALKQMIIKWSTRKACRKHELLSLIGHLSHACKVVPPGRPFLRRLIELSTKAKLLHHHLRLNIQVRCDLQWWSMFLQRWNGTSMMSLLGSSSASVTVTSDASGSWGCGAVSNADWFSCGWGSCWLDVHITIKELLPIILASALWGHSWAGHRVLFRCDNAAVVAIINSGRSRNSLATHLARALFLLCAAFKFTFRATRIAGVCNRAADALSRNNIPLFLQISPQASPLPYPITNHLYRVLILSVPDWLSLNWRSLFSSILERD